MQYSNSNHSSKESRAGAGIAGAGSGTLLIGIANTLPEGNIFKPILFYSAPSVTAQLSIVWLWAQVEIGNTVLFWKLRSLYKSTKAAHEEALNNPNTSAPHKKLIRERLEALEDAFSRQQLKRINSITPLEMPKLPK